jgi:hypothetical protein
MNLRSDFAAARPLALAQAFVAPLGPAACAVLFDEPAGTALHARLTVRLAGGAPPQVFLSARLELRAGGARRLVLLRRPAEEIEARGVLVELAGLPAATIDPAWLQAPRVAAEALLDGLAAPGLRQLLRLALGTAASALGAAAGPSLAALADRAFARIGSPELVAAAWTPFGAEGGIMTWRLPAALDPAALGPLVLAGPAGVAQRPLDAPRLERAGAARLLHLHLPARPQPDAAAIGLGPQPAALRPPAPERPSRPFAAWLARRDPATRAWALGLLESAAAGDPRAAALAAELRHAADPAPRLAVRALAGDPGGVLYALALDDPHGLVAAIRIERGAARLDLAATHGEIAGRAALPRSSAIEDRARIRLLHRSGRLRAAFDGPLPPFRGPAPQGLAGPDAVSALAASRLAMDRPARRAATLDFGPRPRRLALSVVAPVGPDLDLLRARAALVAAEPGGLRVEIVCPAAEGPEAKAAAAVLEHTSAVFGLAHRLVVLDAAADAADLLLAGLAAAEGPSLLLMGERVLPDGPGWLAPWRRLGPGRPLAGAVLLDHDGAVLDAGGPLAGPGRFAGLPAADLPRAARARTARLSAACAGLARAAAERLAAGPRHPNPDVMLAALAAAYAAEGRPPSVRLASRFRRFGAPGPTALDAAADAAAAAALVKASFRTAGAERGPCRP